MIELTGYIDVPEGRREAIAAALPLHVELTRAETGCVRFDVTPDPEVEGRYNVSELFTDRESFNAHQARVKASAWGEISAGIRREYSIRERNDFKK
ncbi:putative quinol monooxygenase [Marivivens sp. JLT3646]|uniref:putative quinol monooxygenase n=1 Tax=Marivivens sp. JLT3646 TaxID=1920883 RepID=UPI0007FCAE34|nr:antibiotic biosynthesis monooxygenase [Marivivens sp. JLT3646]APO86733.1 antibiotic biosynthesis monooxygenase [Marivivens sp. JLT3646]OBR39463.1 antibiotic biosynthesis monooxygenase [Donghicola sp. JL3646]